MADSITHLSAAMSHSLITTPPDWLNARTAVSPHALALIIGEQRWTYAELNELVNRSCRWLEGWDVPPHGRVGLLMGNSLAYVCLVYAVARLGHTLVPLNTRLTAVELAWQIEQAACDMVLCDPDQQEKLELNRGVVVSPPQLFRQSPWEAPSRWSTTTNQTQAQAILFTSGTTGNPKGVAISFTNHFYSALGSAYKLGVLPNDLWLSCLPLYHVGGLAVIFRSCLYGTAVDLHPRWELDAVNHALDSRPITLISVVPTMLYRLVQSRTAWPSSLRLILVGGAAATPELVAQANGLALSQGHERPLVATTYGMTETTSQIATLLPPDTAVKPASVGQPLLFTQVQIMDEQGQPLAAGEIGEIGVQGPTVTSGYVNNEQANAERFVNGWFRTGDMGYQDPDGDLWLVQRRADLIVSGGENVYPAEVERVLRMHTAVEEACVVGLPDPEWGQKVAALVQLAPGKTVTAKALLAFGREKLAGYKQPRFIQFTTNLPLTASGKIARRQVQTLLAQSQNS